MIQLTGTLISQREEIEKFFDLSTKSVPLYYNEFNLPGIPSMIMMPPDIQRRVYEHISRAEIELEFQANSDDDWLPTVTVIVGDHSDTFTVSRDGIKKNYHLQQPLGKKVSLVVVFNNQPSEAFYFKTDDINWNSTKSVQLVGLNINGAQVINDRDYYSDRSSFTAFERIDGADSHADPRTMYTNGIYRLELLFPVLNDVLNCNKLQNRDDIRTDDESLYTLKEELLKYNHTDVEKWLKLLHESRSH